MTIIIIIIIYVYIYIIIIIIFAPRDSERRRIRFVRARKVASDSGLILCTSRVKFHSEKFREYLASAILRSSSSDQVPAYNRAIGVSGPPGRDAYLDVCVYRADLAELAGRRRSSLASTRGEFLSSRGY